MVRKRLFPAYLQRGSLHSVSGADLVQHQKKSSNAASVSYSVRYASRMLRSLQSNVRAHHCGCDFHAILSMSSMQPACSLGFAKLPCALSAELIFGHFFQQLDSKLAIPRLRVQLLWSRTWLGDQIHLLLQHRSFQFLCHRETSLWHRNCLSLFRQQKQMMLVV